MSKLYLLVRNDGHIQGASIDTQPSVIPMGCHLVLVCLKCFFATAFDVAMIIDIDDHSPNDGNLDRRLMELIKSSSN